MDKTRTSAKLPTFDPAEIQKQSESARNKLDREEAKRRKASAGEHRDALKKQRAEDPEWIKAELEKVRCIIDEATSQGLTETAKPAFSIKFPIENGTKYIDCPGMDLSKVNLEEFLKSLPARYKAIFKAIKKLRREIKHRTEFHYYLDSDKVHWTEDLYDVYVSW